MNRKKFYQTLNDDVKAKIKGCRSEEEMMKVLSDERIPLPPELLDWVAGGREDRSGEDRENNSNSACD